MFEYFAQFILKDGLGCVAAVLPQPGRLFVVHRVEVCGLNVAGVDSNFVHVGNEPTLDG